MEQEGTPAAEHLDQRGGSDGNPETRARERDRQEQARGEIAAPVPALEQEQHPEARSH